MKNRFYMNEFKYHDGECYVTFNIVDLNELKNEISVAITREGKISVVTPRPWTGVQGGLLPLDRNVRQMVRPRAGRQVYQQHRRSADLHQAFG